MVSPSRSPLLERSDFHSSSLPMEAFSMSDEETEHHLTTKSKLSHLQYVKMSTICKGLLLCLLFAAGVQLAFQMGISHASGMSCGGVSYSKLFMDLSAAREELAVAQSAHTQCKHEISSLTTDNSDSTLADSHLVDERVQELEQSLDRAHADMRHQAKHIEYLEKMLRTQNLQDLAAVTGHAHKEQAGAENMSDTEEASKGLSETDTNTLLVSDLRIELQTERRQKEEALVHAAQLQQEMSKERTLAAEEKETAVAEAIEQTASDMNAQSTRIVDSYSHFVDVLSHLNADVLDEGLTGAMKTGGLDRVMAIISRGFEQPEGTAQHVLAARLSHWLSIARRGDNGQNPLVYYKDQGIHTLDLLARNGFSFSPDASVLEYSTVPLGVIEYITNEKSYSVSPLGEHFDVMFNAVRRKGVSRFTSHEPLLRKLKSKKDIDNLTIRIDTRDSFAQIIDELPSFLGVLRPNGWFMVQLSASSDLKTPSELEIRKHIEAFSHRYTWDCSDGHPDNQIECVVVGTTKA